MDWDKRQKKEAIIIGKLGKYQIELKNFTKAYNEARSSANELDDGSDNDKSSESSSNNAESLYEKVDEIIESTESVKQQIVELIESVDKSKIKSLSPDERQELVEKLKKLDRALHVDNIKINNADGNTYSSSGSLRTLIQNFEIFVSYVDSH